MDASNIQNINLVEEVMVLLENKNIIHSTPDYNKTYSVILDLVIKLNEMMDQSYLDTVNNCEKSQGILDELDGLEAKNKKLRKKLKVAEKEIDYLKSIKKDECNCSRDYVAGSSPNYYCGKCGNPMRG